MGAIAPLPIITPEMEDYIMKNIMQPTIDGLYEEGRPFVGVLFAGLMITKQGPRVLEFNCRFGDPETQVIIPLLKTDLFDIIQHCIYGNLNDIKIEWYNKYAVTIVAASRGYPDLYLKEEYISGKYYNNILK